MNIKNVAIIMWHHGRKHNTPPPAALLLAEGGVRQRQPISSWFGSDLALTSRPPESHDQNKNQVSSERLVRVSGVRVRVSRVSKYSSSTPNTQPCIASHTEERGFVASILNQRSF